MPRLSMDNGNALFPPPLPPEYGCGIPSCIACQRDWERQCRQQGDIAATWAAVSEEEPTDCEALCDHCGLFLTSRIGRSRYRVCRCGEDTCPRCGGYESDGCECDRYCDTCGAFTGGTDRECFNCLGGRINSYGFKPAPVFHGVGPLFLGMELETETEDKMAAACAAIKGFGNLVYLKEDGSIRDGFELVTHPMDHDYAMGSVNWSALRDMESAGAFVRPNDNGIHVHVSRDGFSSDAHVYRWMKLLYRNQAMMVRAARRDSTWARWEREARQAHKHTARKCQTSDSQRASYNFGRYQAINTANDPTLELRVFASSLDPATVTGTLSLVAGTVEYTRNIDAAAILRRDAWSWRSLTSWLQSSDGKPFKAATTYLESVCAC